MNKTNLVIFGASNILSDIVECALAKELVPSKIILDLPEPSGTRDLSIDDRIKTWAHVCPAPIVESFKNFNPQEGELYILGPTTPSRENLLNKVLQQYALKFYTLIHPTAYISSMATIGDGVFVGAGSLIGPGALIENHVFINRGVTIGHDTHVQSFTRIQPGCNIGGLTNIGRSVSIGIGATIIDRIVVGNHSLLAAGSVLLDDLPSKMMAAGSPAIVKKHL